MKDWKRIELASQSRMKAVEHLASRFFTEVIGIAYEDCLVTDESDLSDLTSYATATRWTLFSGDSLNITLRIQKKLALRGSQIYSSSWSVGEYRPDAVDVLRGPPSPRQIVFGSRWTNRG